MTDTPEGVVSHGSISSIEVSEEQFEMLLDDADNPALPYLDYVDVDGRSYEVHAHPYKSEVNFLEVDDGA